MIHFLKSASLLSLIIPSLEPHLSALRKKKKKKTQDPKMNACEMKTPCLCNLVLNHQMGKCCHLLIPFW